MSVATSTSLLACSGEVGTRSSPSATRGPRGDKGCGDAIFPFWFLLVSFGHPRWETCNQNAVQVGPSLDRVSFCTYWTTACHTMLLSCLVVIEVRWDIRDFGPNRQFPMTWRLTWIDGRHWMYFVGLIRTLIWGCKCSQAQWTHRRIDKSRDPDSDCSVTCSVEVVGAYFGDTARRRALQGCGTLEWRLSWLGGSARLEGLDLNIRLEQCVCIIYI